jgi:hypothetical protein
LATLLFNTAGGNTAVGSRALLNNTTGGTLGIVQGLDIGPNVAVGQQALESNTVASANTAVGYQALHSFTAGPLGFEQLGLCTAVGFQALANATGNGLFNSAFGYQALFSNTDGGGNTAIGLVALFNNATGSDNLATGNSELFHNTTGDGNVGTGSNALVNNDTGSNNTAIGPVALGSNTTGSDNTAVGHNALDVNIGGNSNTALGVQAGAGVTTASNVICIGANVLRADVNNSCYIGNILGATSPGGLGIFVNSDGKLGTNVSSARFKDKIKPMDQASETILALQPVTFRYKKKIDPTGTAQFGLVAEEVEKVNPDLVVHDKEGKPYSVRYDQVNAMLLNEFLKEHRKVQEQTHELQEQKATISELRTALESVVARLKEQDSKIQRVCEQVELGRADAQMALNNR